MESSGSAWWGRQVACLSKIDNVHLFYKSITGKNNKKKTWNKKELNGVIFM